MKFRIGFWTAITLVALLSVVSVSAQLTGPVVSGTVVLDGSNPSSVTTGLQTLTSCVVTAQIPTNPLLRWVIFTVQFTPTSGQLDVYAWAPTSSSNPTLVASTNVGDRVTYICTGRTN